MIQTNDKINVDNLVALVDKMTSSYKKLDPFLKTSDGKAHYENVPTTELVPVLKEAIHHGETLKSMKVNDLWNYSGNLKKRLDTLIIDGADMENIENIDDRIKLEIPQSVKQGIMDYMTNMFKQINGPIAGYDPINDRGQTALAKTAASLNEMYSEFKNENNLCKSIILLKNIIIETRNMHDTLNHFYLCKSEFGDSEIGSDLKKLLNYAQGKETVSFDVEYIPNKSGYGRTEITLEKEIAEEPSKKGYLRNAISKCVSYLN